MSGVKVNMEKCTELVPGVLKKNEKTFYIQCSVNKTWHYCNKDRLNRLIAKRGNIEEVGKTYVSRAAKAAQKAQADNKEPEVIQAPNVDEQNVPEAGEQQNSENVQPPVAE